MTVSIQVLERGGCSTFGRSSYDPRADVVVICAHDGEVVNVVASFPDDVSTVNYDTDGIETTEPAISSASITFELSNFNAGNRIRYDALLSSGEMRQLNIEIAGSAARAAIGSAGGDYGSFT